MQIMYALSRVYRNCYFAFFLIDQDDTLSSITFGKMQIVTAKQNPFFLNIDSDSPNIFLANYIIKISSSQIHLLRKMHSQILLAIFLTFGFTVQRSGRRLRHLYTFFNSMNAFMLYHIFNDFIYVFFR